MNMKRLYITLVKKVLNSVDQTQLHVQMMEHLSLLPQHVPVSVLNFQHVFSQSQEVSLAPVFHYLLLSLRSYLVMKLL